MAGDWDKHRYSRDFEEVELLIILESIFSIDSGIHKT